MQIILHGKLGEEYGREHTIQASSIFEALRALSQQLGIHSEIPVDKRPVVRVVGHLTEESLQECPEKIDVVLAMIGGGAFGKIVIGALMIAVGVVTQQTWLIAAGVSMALSGVAQLFIKAPSLSKNTDPDASKYLGLGNNTTKLGTLRSYSMGRVKITAPHVIAVNVDSNDLVKGEFPV